MGIIAVVAALTAFSIGDCTVNLMPSCENIMPTIRFVGRGMSFAYRTDGWLMDGDKGVEYHSDPTNCFAVLKKTAKGVRADYVHSLYSGKGDKRRFVGVCSNEVVFADGVIGVRATLFPAEPGRYRFRACCKASQVIAFHDYARKWVGTTLRLVVSEGVSFMNELTPHDRFNPEAWGMGWRDTGYAPEMVFANVPGVIRFMDVSGARFDANRYKGGFEANAVCINDDVMHRPAWDKPFSFSYAVKMQK